MSEPEAIEEGRGATLGEAKWMAVKALARRFPGLGAEHVEFEVLAPPGETTEALVRAVADLDAWGEARALAGDGGPVERVRELLERVVSAMALRASVEVADDGEEIRGEVVGGDLAVFIGRRGQTIDAVQHLATRIAFKGEQHRRRVTIDAAGYRERRAGALRRMGEEAAGEALASGGPVPLEPLGAAERRIVHEYLRDYAGVETHSEGDEPNRYLVVAPVAP